MLRLKRRAKPVRLFLAKRLAKQVARLTGSGTTDRREAIVAATARKTSDTIADAEITDIEVLVPAHLEVLHCRRTAGVEGIPPIAINRESGITDLPVPTIAIVSRTGVGGQVAIRLERSTVVKKKKSAKERKGNSLLELRRGKCHLLHRRKF